MEQLTPPDPVLLLDFSEWDDDETIALSQYELPSGLLAQQGDTFLAEDDHGNSCEVLVVKANALEARLVPKWETWRSAADVEEEARR